MEVGSLWNRKFKLAGAAQGLRIWTEYETAGGLGPVTYRLELMGRTGIVIELPLCVSQEQEPYAQNTP